MTIKMRLFLLALSACYISAVYAGLPFSNDPKCRCVTQTSAKMNPKTFDHIEMIPRGARCGKVEIIVTLKNKHIVCVNPEAMWIQHVIKTLIQRRNTTE
ncbi:C-X-C motif chemokine 13-like isoform X2 [Acipenser oxyrinchus oxyrinchus]|uniref:C-X-C motif chemokine 13-like isoform X2 n=1 Tax=Acipenser oxyrinchus oxyrinchus TaxID=40147 RepID=A0AAD8LTB2_ACIOX|nr:C-X-C motif chemokine 13-like isoform X2 [Acipenser oxyrinchus oxyrinchus]KAK1174311.1 C-X-C motif chemokine 13-like isoform X2 [Acipenser oxyrinchus oxyrinchus]